MAKKISILVCEPMAPDGLEMLERHTDFVVDVALNLSPQDLGRRIVDYDCLLVRSQTNVDRTIITLGKNLKLIGRAGVGVDNIDITCAKELGIAVINTPSGNSISTAELALGLIISLARKIPFAHRDLHGGKWQRNKFKGMELFQKTLGIVGFGNVGRQLAMRAQAFGLKLMCYDPFISPSICSEYDVINGSIDEVFGRADFLSLHCGLSLQTKNIINETNIAKMKRGIFLINTARGELIDDQALLSALNSGHIAGAALDVFRTEPPAPNDPLLRHENIIVTPHLGASTNEAQHRVSTLLAEQAIGFFSGSSNLTRVV